MRINDIDLHVSVAGRGDPLVLVHGSWVDARSWALVAPALTDRFTVVTYDRRGHSRSERPLGAVVRRDDEDDLIELVEQLELGPVHLAGNSYGGCIALSAASRRPDLVRTVTAHEPPFAAELPDPERSGVLGLMADIVDALADDVVAGVRRFVEEVALGPGAWDVIDGAQRATFVANAPMFPHLLADPDGMRFLGAPPVPSSVSMGTESAPWFRRVAESLDGLQQHTFVGAGHAPHLTHVIEYAAHLEEVAMSPAAQ